MTSEEMEKIYQQAIKIMNESGKDEGGLYIAAGKFESLGDYKDSIELANDCKNKGDGLVKSKTINNAVNIAYNKNSSDSELIEARKKLEAQNNAALYQEHIEYIDNRLNKRINPKYIVCIIAGVLIVVGALIGILLFNRSDDQIAVPYSSQDANGRIARVVYQAFEKAGFSDVRVELDDGQSSMQQVNVYRITVDGESEFDKGEEFDSDVEVIIYGR